MSRGSYVKGLHDAYNAGLRAGRANLPLSMNPYKRWEHRGEWEKGWLKGQQEDEADLHERVQGGAGGGQEAPGE